MASSPGGRGAKEVVGQPGSFFGWFGKSKENLWPESVRAVLAHPRGLRIALQKYNAEAFLSGWFEQEGAWMARIGVDGGNDQQTVPHSQLRCALLSVAELGHALRWVPPNGVRYTLPQIIQEMLLTTTSERQGRVIDFDMAASMEKKKQEGYF